MTHSLLPSASAGALALWIIICAGCGTGSVTRSDTWALPPEDVPLYFERVQLTLRDGRQIEVRDAILQDSMLFSVRVQKSERANVLAPVRVYRIDDIRQFRFSNIRGRTDGWVLGGLLGGLMGFWTPFITPSELVGFVYSGGLYGYLIGTLAYTDWMAYDPDTLRAWGAGTIASPADTSGHSGGPTH